MKTIYDIWGYQHSCPNYDPCPVCYGCRACDPSWIKCSHCLQDPKKDICNKKKHTIKALNKMIRRPKFNVRT